MSRMMTAAASVTAAGLVLGACGIGYGIAEHREVVAQAGVIAAQAAQLSGDSQALASVTFQMVTAPVPVVHMLAPPGVRRSHVSPF